VTNDKEGICEKKVTTVPVPNFEPAPSEYEAGVTSIRLQQLLRQRNMTKSNSVWERCMDYDSGYEPVYTEKHQRDPQRARNFFTSWATTVFSKRIVIELILKNPCQYYYGSFFRKGHGDRGEHLGSMTACMW